MCAMLTQGVAVVHRAVEEVAKVDWRVILGTCWGGWVGGMVGDHFSLYPFALFCLDVNSLSQGEYEDALRPGSPLGQ